MPNLDLYYRNCVIGGPGAIIVVTHDFKAFAAAIRRKLVLEIAGRSIPDGQLPQGPRRLAFSHDRFPLSAPRDWVCRRHQSNCDHRNCCHQRPVPP